MPDRLVIDVSPSERSTALAYPAASDRRTQAAFVLAHGAGAGQSSSFIVQFASGLASRGVDVLTFNFFYTEAGRRVPDSTEKLERCYRAVVAVARGYGPFGGNALFIGGKSMGGRIASHLAAQGETGLGGLIFLGYPLHPPGAPDRPRTVHLPQIRVPMLFVQGSRDPFGTPGELRPILNSLEVPVTLHVVESGDHSLAPAKGSRLSPEQGRECVQDVMARWIRALVRP